eukprot:TRINITY_DN43_c0_g2_i1.p1 TRINITY_DN43_c0_g2~~TRINITY_DN43_c0_g2_i1.p1  ORF type:complete len:280 (-),score=69.37 TRINITY_DN43_c0_g2_i1:96-878(-)
MGGGLEQYQRGERSDAQYFIFGEDSQVLQVPLSGAATIVAEPGTMAYRHKDLTISTGCGNPANACCRMCSGEACCRVTYANEKGVEGAYVALTPNFPSKVVPIHLADVGKEFVAKSGAWMASQGAVDVTTFFTSCLTGCYGGSGFCMQRLSGDGVAFLAASGTVVFKDLADGETIVVDTNSVVGFAATCKYEVALNAGFCNCCCGGEGCFNTTVTGPGRVYVQSMSFEKLAMEIRKAIQPQGAGAGADGGDAAAAATAAV